MSPAPGTRVVFDAVVLAGGRGRRLGGTDKAEVMLAGRALIDRVLDAAALARSTVIVGPPRHGRHGVSSVLEEPPGGGPVAGLWAGVDVLDRRHPHDDAAVLVLACDVPLASRAVPGLLAALVGDSRNDGAHLVDTDGRAQSLVAIYRRAPLRAGLERLPGRGRSMGQLLAGLTLTPVMDAGGDGMDADTWDDVATLGARIRRRDVDHGSARDPLSSQAADGAERSTTR
jgi:molybdopterin-guanine dinucleotide biosynthesis protein A